eukprot:TRINITY_DN3845_c0_g2_i1.p1 TRINITY_DN3845_c0_g2~~TRINITY_DN3845_c0_g2_i1.p1  ORF type:complete len:546 (+),score=192.21 TRINITY_DN3845_c0_g2_i1:100-1737(+)
MDSLENRVEYTPLQIEAVKKIQSFWKSHIFRCTVKKLGKIHSKRTRVFDELLETEALYINGLCQIQQIIMPELEKVFSLSDAKVIFGLIPTILAFNKEFRLKLETKRNTWSFVEEIGPIFEEISQYLKIYAVYCKSYTDAIITLERCMKKTEVTETIKLLFETHSLQYNTIPSYLILPVQRIPRYNLLLKEIVKLTLPTHPDYKTLVSAQHKINEIALYINEKTRDDENKRKINSIQANMSGKFKTFIEAGRALIRDGELFEKVRDRKKRRYVILFSDKIVFSKEKKQSRFGSFKPGSLRWEHLKEFSLANTIVTSHLDVPRGIFSFSLTCSSSGKDYDIEFLATNEEDVQSWINSINGAIRDFKSRAEELDNSKIKIAKQKAAQAKTMLEAKYVEMRVEGSTNRFDSLRRKKNEILQSEGLTNSIENIAGSHRSCISAISSEDLSILTKRSSLTLQQNKIYSKLSYAERVEQERIAKERIEELEKFEQDKQTEIKDQLKNKFDSLTGSKKASYRDKLSQVRQRSSTDALPPGANRSSSSFFDKP